MTAKKSSPANHCRATKTITAPTLPARPGAVNRVQLAAVCALLQIASRVTRLLRCPAFFVGLTFKLEKSRLDLERGER